MVKQIHTAQVNDISASESCLALLQGHLHVLYIYLSIGTVI